MFFCLKSNKIDNYCDKTPESIKLQFTTRNLNKKLFRYIVGNKINAFYQIMRIYHFLCIGLISLALTGCKPAVGKEGDLPEISFFYWKSTFNVKDVSSRWLDSIPVNKLYIRFFDIDVDVYQNPIPVAPLTGLPEKLPYSLTPVIFITNETFLKVKEEKGLVDLADKLVGKLLQMSQPHKVKEWLIDCDWSPKTRIPFFNFCRILNEKARSNQIELMATIRLDQYKNVESTGVPPVKSGLLMAYNMGALANWETSNSILNEKDALVYLQNPKQYPLPLTLGLPFYQWGVVFRDSIFTGLINGLDTSDLADSTRFKKTGENTFEISENTFLQGFYLYERDKIRIEKVGKNEILSIIHLLKKWKSVNDNKEIVFFHLDERIMDSVNGSFFKHFSQKVSIEK
jgi:hypothetical protein